VTGEQSVRLAARRSAFDVQAARGGIGPMGRQLDGLAVELLVALRVRDATVAMPSLSDPSDRAPAGDNRRAFFSAPSLHEALVVLPLLADIAR
jgi:hypothetical protein